METHTKTKQQVSSLSTVESKREETRTSCGQSLSDSRKKKKRKKKKQKTDFSVELIRQGQNVMHAFR